MLMCMDFNFYLYINNLAGFFSMSTVLEPSRLKRLHLFLGK